jgi:hypothetical protein
MQTIATRQRTVDTPEDRKQQSSCMKRPRSHHRADIPEVIFVPTFIVDQDIAPVSRWDSGGSVCPKSDSSFGKAIASPVTSSELTILPSAAQAEELNLSMSPGGSDEEKTDAAIVWSTHTMKQQRQRQQQCHVQSLPPSLPRRHGSSGELHLL